MTLARAVVPELKHHKGALAALRKRPENLKPKQQTRLDELIKKPVSYTHLTLPTIYSV